MKLHDFLRLGVIVGPFPNQILNGQIEDAVPVMNDFNWLRDQVNANVPPLIPTVSTFATYVAQASVGGSANAITLTPTPAIAAYAEGQSFRFRATNTNTGAVTVATSGLAVRNLQTASGGALTGGEIVAGGEYDICDTGTVYQLVNASQGTAPTGAWTPSLTFGGASVGMTYTNREGKYVKINDLVYIAWYFTLSNKGTSVGTAQIAGLPFAPNTNIITISGAPVLAGNIEVVNINNPAGNGWLACTVTNGATTMNITGNASASGPAANLTQADFSNNSVMSASGLYIA